MKRVISTLLLFAFFSFGSPMAAQEKAKSEEGEKKANGRKEITPLRIQVVFNEFEGEKRISSLPYTLLVNAETARGQKAAIRMGLRVPIVTGSFTTGSGAQNQFQYIDVGTNLDGWASKEEDDRFILHLSLDRSSAYSPGAGQKTAPVGGNEVLSTQPVIQQFRTEVDLLIRDGQTIQSTMATDPVSGHVIKVDVTMNVMK